MYKDKVRINFNIQNTAKNQLQKSARERNLSMSSYLRYLIEKEEIRRNLNFISNRKNIIDNILDRGI